MSAKAMLDRAREWLFLERLQARVDAVPDELRAKTARALTISEQRRRGAEALWSSGSRAEALRLARESIELARSAVREGGGSPADDPLPEVPELDGEVRPEHARALREMLELHARLLHDHRELHLDRRAVLRQQAVRTAAGGLVLVVAVLAAGRLTRTTRVAASAQYDAEHTALEVIDRSERTEWLLPTSTGGFIDLQLKPPRKIARVKLMNARNLPWNDRGSREVVLDAWDGTRQVKHATAAFDGISNDPKWQVIEVGERVERVRVSVKTWYGAGGGFAEIVLE
ncbi:MAG: hypothetical protein HYV09_24060 [Deltaproteobacteria bacterium]|nr:hypothetical protein [Deltaproteobacteria bacterium]